MIKVYKHGCLTCGIDGIYIRRIKAYGVEKSIPVELLNSRYDEFARAEHAAILEAAGLDLSNYAPIVVQDGSVKELRKWKP